MGTLADYKATNGLESVQETLARLGVADDADWMALVLFARNLVSVMDIFTDDQKAQLQARIFEQMAKRPLDQHRFLQTVQTIQAFLLENQKVEDMRSQLAAERQGFNALYEEMSKVFTEIQQTTVARENSIQRLGADTEKDIAKAGSHDEVLSRLRGMITEMVSQAREEARTWQERARQLEHTAKFDPLLSELYSRRALDAQLGDALERCRRNNIPLSLMFSTWTASRPSTTPTDTRWVMACFACLRPSFRPMPRSFPATPPALAARSWWFFAKGSTRPAPLPRGRKSGRTWRVAPLSRT